MRRYSFALGCQGLTTGSSPLGKPMRVLRTEWLAAAHETPPAFRGAAPNALFCHGELAVRRVWAVRRLEPEDLFPPSNGAQGASYAGTEAPRDLCRMEESAACAYLICPTGGPAIRASRGLCPTSRKLCSGQGPRSRRGIERRDGLNERSLRSADSGNDYRH
jgi:hypothetical protein